ncbi:CxC2 domain-containing protein [Mycena kentingensis (nom. inval.)]|nr:CxC2 domain-containing protein [Mycena kentingensis (nom. inval.)]
MDDSEELTFQAPVDRPDVFGSQPIQNTSKGKGKLGESRRVMSWIWKFTGTQGSDAEMRDAIRAEWCKAYARVRRWREEVLLLEEEWRQLPLSFGYEERSWVKRAGSVKIGSEDTEVAEGKIAYAAKKADMYRDLARRAEITRTEAKLRRGERRPRQRVEVYARGPEEGEEVGDCLSAEQDAANNFSEEYVEDTVEDYGYPADPSSISVSYATTSDFTRRDFVFSRIQVTDDDAYLHTLDAPPAFGTIRLELWEVAITGIQRAPYQHTYGNKVLEAQVIHEQSKTAGAHHVRFGGEYVVPQPAVNVVTGTKTGHAPLAIFTLNYRPCAAHNVSTSNLIATNAPNYTITFHPGTACLWHCGDSVKSGAAVSLGHHGARCPNADAPQAFTLVDGNGIHATAVAFCECSSAERERMPYFEQLLRAGVFPGSVGGKTASTPPKTGYTMQLLDYYEQAQNQGKGSAYDFVLVLQRLADPFFSDSVPDVYANFLAITRFHQYIVTLLRRGHAHGLATPLPGETERPYAHRAIDFMGQICAACPERGVNMPLTVNVPTYLRHLISQNLTLDGNYKANLFYKRDDGTQISLTDGRMLFPKKAAYTKFTKDFALGTYAQREFLRHTNSPPHEPQSQTPRVNSYDSHCSFVVHMVDRAKALFPEETWLHEILASAEGQIPADHINGHGHDCRVLWQAVYAACRAHFHGETAEVVWAFLNALGASTRQMTGPARHDVMNFVMDAWNNRKVLRQAQLLADERVEALRLFELHMAVLVNLSRQHADHVGEWSRVTRAVEKLPNGTVHSVYHHASTTALTMDAVLASLLSDERKRVDKEANVLRTGFAQWIHDGIDLERQSILVVALLRSHAEHPLEDTANTIRKLRERVLLRCSQANGGVLAVRATSLALSAAKKAREDDYRGQAAVTRSKRNVEKAVLTKRFEIDMYMRARSALVDLGYMAGDATEPYPQLTERDTRRKETHLHRAKGDSRVFDGTAWYLQSGETFRKFGPAPSVTVRGDGVSSDEEEPRLLGGTQSLKRSGFKKSPQPSKRLRDILPADVAVQSSASEVEDSDMNTSPVKGTRTVVTRRKRKAPKPDGWVWLDGWSSGKPLSDDRLADYQRESDQVQWMRAEAEMYRWLEQYERKHAELHRVIERFRRDAEMEALDADDASLMSASRDAPDSDPDPFLHHSFQLESPPPLPTEAAAAYTLEFTLPPPPLRRAYAEAVDEDDISICTISPRPTALDSSLSAAANAFQDPRDEYPVPEHQDELLAIDATRRHEDEYPRPPAPSELLRATRHEDSTKPSRYIAPHPSEAAKALVDVKKVLRGPSRGKLFGGNGVGFKDPGIDAFTAQSA